MRLSDYTRFKASVSLIRKLHAKPNAPEHHKGLLDSQVSEWAGSEMTSQVECRLLLLKLGKAWEAIPEASDSLAWTVTPSGKLETAIKPTGPEDESCQNQAGDTRELSLTQGFSADS